MIFKNNLVSIIVPIFKVELYLSECIESLMIQTYKNIEILLVDDGSPDSCGAICDEYAKLDTRITVIHQENKGLSGARNTGIKNAQGDYFIFMDSDDWVEPDYVEQLIKHADKDTIVACGFFEENIWTAEHKGKLNQFYNSAAIEVYLNDELNSALGKSCLFMGSYAWNKIYPKSVFATVRYPEGKKFEDILTVIDIFKCCKRLVVIEKCLYHYRIRDGAITSIKSKENQFHHLSGRLHQEEILKDSEDLLQKAEALTLLAVTYIYKEAYNGNYSLNGKEKDYLKNIITTRKKAFGLMNMRKRMLLKVLLHFEWFSSMYFKIKYNNQKL